MLSKIGLYKILLTLIFLATFSTTLMAQDYNKWFTENVMRIDLTHAGDAKTEYYFTEQFYKEEVWAGSKTKLIDKLSYGDNFFEVYDSTSQTLIYSRGYNNLFYEWQAEPEAKHNNRSFEEVIRFPFPLETVQIKIYRRLLTGELEPLHQFYLNPKSYRVIKGTKYNFETERLFGELPVNKAVDIVIMADGYTKEELSVFKSDATKLSEFLLNTEPFSQLKERFNIWLIMSDSKESGTDIPRQDIWKNTVFDSHFNTFNSERYLTSQSIKKIHDVAALVPYDQVYVLVNTDKYGGGGIFNYYNLTSAHHALSPWVFIHEFGHGFAGLADEYPYGAINFEDVYSSKSEPWNPNISTLAKPDKKWKNMMDKDTPIPTPVTEEYKNKVGFYEGGGYLKKGIYRPYQECEMRTLKSGFCPVCQDAIIKMIKFNIDQ